MCTVRVGESACGGEPVDIPVDSLYIQDILKSVQRSNEMAQVYSMNKNMQNAWIDLGMFGLLTLTVLAALIEVATHCFIHVVLGLLLSLGAWIHIALHWDWIANAFKRFRKLPDKVRDNFVLNLALFGAYSAAGTMGLVARGAIFTGPFHIVLGCIHVMLALVVITLQTIHLARHWKWIASTTKKMFSPAA